MQETPERHRCPYGGCDHDDHGGAMKTLLINVLDREGNVDPMLVNVEDELTTTSRPNKADCLR